MNSDLQGNDALNRNDCLGEDSSSSGSCPGREGLDVFFKGESVVEAPKSIKDKKLAFGDIINAHQYS